MIDTRELKAVMARRGKTQKNVADYIGISPKTFYLKMKSGIFLSNEMDAMVEYLEIEDPMAIFFAKEVTY